MTRKGQLKEQLIELKQLGESEQFCATLIKHGSGGIAIIQDGFSTRLN